MFGYLNVLYAKLILRVEIGFRILPFKIGFKPLESPNSKVFRKKFGFTEMMKWLFRKLNLFQIDKKLIKHTLAFEFGFPYNQ